jgi:hypothetical protein
MTSSFLTSTQLTSPSINAAIHRPPLVGAGAIGNALGVSERTVRRLKKQGLLPGVYQLPGRGPNTPYRIDRPGALAALRRFLSRLEA